MNTGFMSKSVSPNNRLVTRNDHTCQTAYQSTGPSDFGKLQRRLGTKEIIAGFKRQCYFFNSCIPCAFTNPVDCAFDLIRSSCDRCQGICSSHTEIIMTMSAELNFLNTGNLFF
ncbi:hypothetical protein D3C74_323810 [compost metagenome]